MSGVGAGALNREVRPASIDAGRASGTAGESASVSQATGTLTGVA